MIEFINGAIKMATNELKYGITQALQGNLEPVVSSVMRVHPGTAAVAPYMEAEDLLTDIAGQNIESATGGAVPALVGSLAVGAVIPGPGEFRQPLRAVGGAIKMRPDVTGLRNAEARAILGDFVTDPAAVAARPGTRLESSPFYKSTQKGYAQPTPGTPMSKLPNILSPHHRVDVKGSIPYFEGSTEAAQIQRRTDLAVADLYPGNTDLNYVGLFDGVLSSKAGKKTGIFSDDHNEVHNYMEAVRVKYGLKNTGGSKESKEISKMIANSPEEMKTTLLFQISLRDELDLNKVLTRRIKLAHEAFPDLSYNEFKRLLIEDPKQFANLYKTKEGNLASYIHPEYRP